jgi:hypothetical protein
MKKKTIKPVKKIAKNIGIITELNNNPTEANWGKAAAKIAKEGKYYFIFYPTGLKEKMSLLDANAVIYGKNFKQLYKVPILKKTSNGIEGATIYLKGLEINRKMIS